jgi:hypothetical protein
MSDLGTDDGTGDAPECLYDCCEHCEHFDDEPVNEHPDPCPEGCNGED